MTTAPATVEQGSTTRRGGLLFTRSALALAVFVMGAIDVASALLSHPPERLLDLERLLPTAVLDTSRTFTLIAGALLLLAAWGLRRGKRRAFVFALFLCALSVPVNVLKSLDVEEATVAAGLLFALGVSSEAFRVKSRELSWRGWGLLALSTFVALVASSTLGAWWIEGRFGSAGGASLAAAFGAAISGLLGLGPDVALPHPTDLAPAARTARWITAAMPVLGVGYACAAAGLALRPARYQKRHEADHRMIEALAEAHATTGVAPFLAAPELDVFVSPNGRAAIAYRAGSDTLLALGDPIGPPEELAPLLAAFETYCRERDWEFAFFQASPAYLPAYAARGWRAIHVGVEPVIDPSTFTLEGGAMGDVRRAARRLEAAGVVVRSFRPGDGAFDGASEPEVLAGLRSVSSGWLAAHPGGEKSFGMGRFDARHLDRRWLLVALAAAGRVEGFVTWAGVPAAGGWTLDLMRRRADAPAGLMDLLVSCAALEAREHGDRVLSLGLSALVAVSPGDDPDAERVRAFLRRRLGAFYDFEGLFHWKRKFQPRFEDRFLVVPGALALPRVLYALARAQTPGGFRATLRGRARPTRTEETG
ncbi:MAG: phosphatidylglycerol lysyltransferase domain-containing protein [Candidatus Eisenbacteria bacterium]